jgi:peroxiredoxin family protein
MNVALSGLRSDPAVLTEMLELRVRELEERVLALPKPADSLTLLIHGAHLDRVLAALSIANGAASMGTQVRIFLAFWGPVILRKSSAKARGAWFDRLIAWIMPKSANDLPLSRMHFGGAGTAMMRKRMRDKNHASVAEQLAMAGELGVELYVCEQSLELLGMNMSDLIDYPGLESCGVATFLGHAMDARATILF